MGTAMTTRSPSKVISGGQTGADRGGLDAAHAAKVPMGGWCPAGRRAEDGRIPDQYPLQETASPDYRYRTALNVEEADGTVVFSFGSLASDGGSELTVDIARTLGKPVLVVDLLTLPTHAAADVVTQWVRDNNIQVLNVAGSRESRAPSMRTRVARVIYRVLLAR